MPTALTTGTDTPPLLAPHCPPQGDVPSVIEALQQCTEAAVKWKELYAVTAAAVKAHSAKPWDFDTSSIFAQVDAFIQRCRDLHEVCDAQLQFSHRAVVPKFSGARAADIDKNFADIQARHPHNLAP